MEPVPLLYFYLRWNLWRNGVLCITVDMLRQAIWSTDYCTIEYPIGVRVLNLDQLGQASSPPWSGVVALNAGLSSDAVPIDISWSPSASLIGSRAGTRSAAKGVPTTPIYHDDTSAGVSLEHPADLDLPPSFGVDITMFVSIF
jgi:hypothetical protein